MTTATMQAIIRALSAEVARALNDLSRAEFVPELANLGQPDKTAREVIEDYRKRHAEAEAALAKATIQGYLLEYVDPPTIEARLLFVARELKELDSLYCSHKFYEQQSDALGDIESQRYDRAIAKLTGNYEPPDGDPREGEICDGN